jgi:hypothetical protein
MGIDGLVPIPPIRNGNQPFLYERYAPLDYTPLHVDPVAIAQSVAGVVVGQLDPSQVAMNVSLNEAASLDTGLLVLVGTLTTRLLAWSLRVDLLAGADGPLNAVVSGLARDLYQPLIPLLLTLVAGWLVWTWLLRRRTMRGVTGIGWVFLAMALSAIYFAQPAGILDQASAFTSAVSRMILGSVGGADIQLHRGDPTVAQGPTDDAELRLFSDRYWSIYVYQPWTVAEFGRLDPKGASGQSLGIELLDKHAGHSNSFDQDLEQQPQEVRDWYNGWRGGDRLVVVAAALLVALAAAFVFLAAAVVRLASTVIFLALLMTLPLFLLLALHPTIGRKLLVRWIELAVGALWRQVLYSLVLAVMVVTVGIITAASAAGGWGVVTLCQLAAMAGFLIFRKPLLAIFGQLGGGRHFSKVQDVGSSRLTEKAHQGLGAARQRVSIPAFARRGGAASTASTGAQKAATAAKAAGGKAATASASSGAAGAAGTAAAGAVTGGLVLVAAAALKGGQMAVRGGEAAKRRLQSTADPFLLNGKAGAPPPRRMPEKPLGADGRALVSQGWSRIHRPRSSAQALPDSGQRSLPNPDPTPKQQPQPRSRPRARWVRQSGGGHLLDVGQKGKT